MVIATYYSKEFSLTDPEGVVIPRVRVGEYPSPVSPEELCSGPEADGEVPQVLWRGVGVDQVGGGGVMAVGDEGGNDDCTGMFA